MKNHTRLIVLCAALSIEACGTDNASVTGELSAQQCAAATPWTAWKHYATGEAVTYGSTV